MYNKKYYLETSPIHGRGMFTNVPIQKGDVIEVAVEHDDNSYPYVNNYFGKWINHSYYPTCELKQSPKDGNYYVKSLKYLQPDIEITCNYNDTPDFIEGPKDCYPKNL